MVEEAEDGYGGSNQRNKLEPKTTEQGGGKAKKGREAKTKTWTDVVKGLKKEGELETDTEVCVI